MKHARLIASLGLTIAAVLWGIGNGAEPLPAQGPATPVTIGPYLQNPAPDGITIMFCTQQPQQCLVEYGRARERLDQKVAATPGSGDAATVYKARLEGLAPGATYYYRVVVGSGGEMALPVYSLTTLNPKAGSATALFFNDLHDNVRLFEALRPRWEGIAFDLMFFNGDCWADPERTRATNTLREVVRLCPAATRPMLLVRGNHEWRGPWQEGLMSHFDLPLGQQKKYYFALSQGPVRFVCLDCGEDCEKRMEVFQPYRQEELKWIEQEVASPEFQQAKYRVMVVHLPLYASAGNADITSAPSQKMWSPALNEAGFDLCVASHVHHPRFLAPADPKTRQKGDVSKCPYAVLIGGGPALKDGDAGTVILLEANADELRVRSVGVDGKTIHHYRKAAPSNR